MSTLEEIHTLLTLCHKTWPTNKARHNLTLDENSKVVLTIFTDELWHTFILEEQDFFDLENVVNAIEEHLLFLG